MLRGTWVENHHEIVAASREGVVRSAALEQFEIGRATVSSRCRPGGPWQRMLPGVVLLHNGPPSWRQRVIAALEYGGPQAMLSGYAGLAALGYPAASSMNPVLLLVPSTQHRRDVSYVTVERTWRLPEAVDCGQLRAAPAVRCLLDASRRMSNIDTCRALLTEGLQRGDVTVSDLVQELAAGSDRGSRVPRAVLRELTDDAHSVAEVQAQKLYATSELPPMVHNRDIALGGKWIARPDGWLDDVALAWEIDSLRYHLSAQQHEATVVRRARMQRAGIVVVTHLPKQLRSEPATVLADLRAGWELAVSRPRPPVYLVGSR
ncbi:hypothetical protein [Rhodococcus sp. NPDC058521]|uniref:hypothetical protein n=1 Tax=Rhodococcus sp. NPDC058521 TaxID=3346536 RepID=UPI00364FD851